MGVFPPWSKMAGNYEHPFMTSAGYAFIASPPEYLASLDWGRLLVQWIVVGIATIGGIALSSDRK